MKLILKRLSAVLLAAFMLAGCLYAVSAANGDLPDTGEVSVTVAVGAVVDSEEVTFTVTAPEDGAYKLGISYKGLGEETGDFVFGLKIDGEYPIEDAKKLNLFRIFTDAPGGNRKDAQGNEFSPRQIPYEGYFYDEVTDNTRWSDNCYLFDLTAGEHTVTLVPGEGTFEVESVSFIIPKSPESYKNPGDYADFYNGEDIIIEGENAKLKTGYWLQSKSDNSTLDISPNDAYKVLANYIGGGNWKTSGQTITWKTPEMKAGYYRMGFSYRQSTILGAKVYRKLRIDGKVPFREAEAIGFPYSYKWEHCFFANNSGDPYLIYLEEGVHEISLEVTSGDITDVRDLLKKAVAALGDLYVDITMITGETVDIYRDYNLFEQIDDMQDRLQAIADTLGSASQKLQSITGEKSGSYISIINNMKKIAELMIENKYTSHRYKDEYYAKYTSLASVLYEISDMPLDIDKISFVSAGRQKPFERAGFFQNLAFSVQKFLVSFTQDYNNLSASSDENSITIWVNWGRDQAQVLDAMIQSDFTPKTGIAVNVQLVNASVVQAVLSGKGPDCLLQHSRSEPVNLAMRGMLYDLSQFSDCDEVLKNFQPGAELPYRYKDGLYGLPDTQSFYLMFYRTDIFEQMELSVPETWDDFKEAAKLLTRKNLTVWMPNNTATSTAQANIGIGSINLFPTLLVQEGLNVYAEGGRSTNLTDSDVIVAFGKWTDYYTKLKLPRTMNFYNRFRTGTCPLGIDTYTLYTTLKAAAPEIKDLWNVALVPGTVRDDGTVSHATTGGGTACSILNLEDTNPNAAWEFLKWWVSAETQLTYSSEVEAILGPTGRIAVSNVEAFNSLQWDPAMKDVITTAMSQIKEIPEYPGSYYVSRSVYQAFWNVVENKQNTKKTLLQFAAEADEEIARKWRQYENR